MTRKSLHSLVMFLVIASLSAVLAVGLVACGDDGDPTDGDADGDADGDTDGDTPDGDTPDGDTPDGDTPDGDTPDGDTPDGDTPDGDIPDGDLDIDTDFDPNMTDFERCVAQSCGNEMDTCMANAECASLLECVSSCDEGEDSCPDQCVSTYPLGAADFGPLAVCAETYCSDV